MSQYVEYELRDVSTGECHSVKDVTTLNTALRDAHRLSKKLHQPIALYRHVYADPKAEMGSSEDAYECRFEAIVDAAESVKLQRLGIAVKGPHQIG